MGQFIDPDDLAPFATIDAAKAGAMIEDAEAMAVLAAPCLPDLLDAPAGESAGDATRRLAKVAALKAILRGAIIRWDEAGSGAAQTTQRSMGPFSESATMDTRQQRRGMFWPSEITQLQQLCSSGGTRAFAVDTVPGSSSHLPWCGVTWGGSCSCGVSIAGAPIFEGVPW